jgi:hypothetical protein
MTTPIEAGPAAWLAALCTLAACQSSISDPDSAQHGSPTPPGRLSFALSAAAELEIAEVTYTIKRAGGFEQSGAIDVTDDGSFKALMLLPSASAYQLDLEAKTVTGAVCTGQSHFDIWPDGKTAVNVVVRCPAAPQIGTADVSGFFNSCPSIDSVLASSQQAAVGDSVDLLGAGSDSDSDSAALTYLWTTTSGVLTNDASAHATLRCTAPGAATVRLTVSDGDLGCDTASPPVEVTCTTPPAAGSGDAAENDAGM